MFSVTTPVQLYGTVYQQQFVKQTDCIRLSASSRLICLLYILITDCPFYILEIFVMHFRSGAEGWNNNRHLLNISKYLLAYLPSELTVAA